MVWNHRAIFPDADIYYTTLTDSGWLEPVNLSDHPSTSYKPDIAIDGQDNIHVVWSDHYYGWFKIFHRIFDGEEWLPFEVVCWDEWSDGSPHLEIDSEDKLHLATGSSVPGNYTDICYFKYNGYSWSSRVNVSNIVSLSSNKPVITIDTYDNPHIAWRQKLDIQIYDIYYSYYNGYDWTESENITNLGLWADHPSLAISSQNIKWMLSL